jgi:hypothetical protein
MSVDYVHNGDFGTEYLINIEENGSALDISAYVGQTIEMYFKPPAGASRKTVTAAMKTDGTNGQVTYTSIAGIIDAVGLWKIEVHLAKTGSDFGSQVGEFEVQARLT